jgi:hypothetical protein
VTEPNTHRFLTVEQTADERNVKSSLIRGLIKTGELRAIQIGGLRNVARGPSRCRGPHRGRISTNGSSGRFRRSR